MTDEQLRSLIQDAYTRRADSVEQMRRTPSQNTPFAPAYQRPERKGQRPAHRDPTGAEAVGNLTPKKRRKP